MKARVMPGSSNGRSVVLVLCVLSGCGIRESLDSITSIGEAPDIPDGYPQLGEYDEGGVEVAVDGIPLDAEGDCRFDDSGVDTKKLRFSMSADFLEFEVLDRLEGEYSSQNGEVTASWSESTSYASGDGCGTSVVHFDGARSFDGLVHNVATWGTLQLVLCSAAGERLEVSGTFSCTL